MEDVRRFELDFLDYLRRHESGILTEIKDTRDFSEDNDPHHEHDMGFFETNGERMFWKFDLYEEPDVKDANGQPVITRVLTLCWPK